MQVRVLVVEGHPLVRWALVHLAEDEPGLQCVGEANNAVDGFDLAARQQPDVVTIDCALPDGYGWTLAERLRAMNPALGIVMLAPAASDELMLRALDGGLSGFEVKTAGVREVVSLLRYAASSVASFSAAGLGDALRRRAVAAEHGVLSPREMQVLQMLQAGLSVPQIAGRLTVSPSTAKTYVARVYDKLGANNRASALMTAMRRGLLAVDPDPLAV
jgi:DNA-binding NarL/FixJ family response regulator